jgi:beta-glucanase (GH16 family)
MALLKTIGSTLISTVLLMLAGPSLAQDDVLPPIDGYTLVWADEFDKDGKPDPKNWGFEEGFKRNGEMQWYQRENASVENGVLVIEGRRTRRANPRFGAPDERAEFAKRRFIEYTSASLTTEGKRQWQYGRFEIRARIKAEQGLWPAIWTLGVDGKWPARGEIDIMEYYEHSILANFAWAARNPSRPTWKSAKIPLAEITQDPDWDKQFHVWVMDWSQDEITLWLDGRLMNRLKLDNVKNGGPDAPLPHPFRQPHFLMLNLALGGKPGGPLAKTTFPSRYEVDYVRVYQRGDGVTK